MKKIAQVISVLFHPILIPLYGMICFFFYSPFAWVPVPLAYKWMVIIFTAVYTIVFPVLILWWMKKNNMVSDIRVCNRTERTKPYIATFILYLVWFWFLWRLAKISHVAVAAMLGVALINLLVLLINLRWKVSAHAAACGGVVGVLIAVSYLLYLNPLWVIFGALGYSLMVMVARLILHEHTSMQVVIGFFVGVFGSLLAYLFCYQFLFS